MLASFIHCVIQREHQEKAYVFIHDILSTMKHGILEKTYEDIFVNVKIYSPMTVFFLRGLAAAIQDAHPSWRPNVSELAEILKSCDKNYRNGLLNAGASYGAAKQIGFMYSGPAILLLGAALQAIGEGSYPNKELENHIVSAKSKLEVLGVKKDQDFIAVLNAAKERAVSELMRTEFREGLKSGGCSQDEGYSQERVDRIVHKIVDITNDVRHRGVIDKTYVHKIEPNTTHMVRGPSGSSFGLVFCDIELSKYEDGIYWDQSGAKIPTIVQDSSKGISDPFAEVERDIPVGGTIMITSDFQDLLPFALKGCAHRILNCINKIRS
jgi:hypothetical protein